MLSRRPLLTFLCSAFVLAAVGCGPSAKNETQYWDNNKKALAEYSARWPGFKTLLEARLATAEPMMAEALKVGDEEKKAEAMKAANAALDPLLGKLTEVKFKSEGVEKAIKNLNDLKLPKSKKEDRRDATKAARDALTVVETAMVEAKPETDEQAVEIASTQISELISAQGAIDRATKRLKPAKAKKGKGKKKK